MVKKQNNSSKNIEIGTLIENFDDKITFIAEQVVAIKETQDLHSQKFDKIDGRLDRVEIRLDGVESKLDIVETRLNDVETKLEKIDKKLDKKADKEEISKLSQRVVALEIKS